MFAGVFSLNGNGEMTGTHWIEESGFLEGPVLITNTHSVGVVRDAVIQWRIRQGDADASGYWWSLPVVAETWDGHLNDINGFHVKPEHVFAALDSARGGAIAEGNVGGGTGMICHEFKCGTGTSSRVVKIDEREYASACWCRRTTACAASCASPAFRSARVLQNDLLWSEPKDDGLDHHRRRHRRAAAAAPAEASRAARVARPRTQRQLFGQRLRRHLHRVLDRERGREPGGDDP